MSSRRLLAEAVAALASTARDYNGRYLYEGYKTNLNYWQNLTGNSARAETARQYQVDRAPCCIIIGSW